MTDLSGVPELDLTTIALLEARAAVNRDATREGFKVTPPSWPGPEEYRITSGIAEPLAGLRFATGRAAAAQSVIKEYIYRARRAGCTWDEIGGVLGLAGDKQPAAAAAFEYAITPTVRPFVRAETFSWRCPECDQRITDAGPKGGHPADDEPGHLLHCPRRARLMAAYQERRTSP